MGEKLDVLITPTYLDFATQYSECFYFDTIYMSIILIIFEKLKWFGYFFYQNGSASSFTIILHILFFQEDKQSHQATTIINCTQTIRASVVQPQFCPFHTKKDFHSKSILMMMLMNLFLIQRFISNWKCQNKLEFFWILRK